MPFSTSLCVCVSVHMVMVRKKTANDSTPLFFFALAIFLWSQSICRFDSLGHSSHHCLPLTFAAVVDTATASLEKSITANCGSIFNSAHTHFTHNLLTTVHIVELASRQNWPLNFNRFITRLLEHNVALLSTAEESSYFAIFFLRVLLDEAHNLTVID